MTTGYADLSDGKVYYEMAGEGETLVLCHAGFVDSGMWDDQWAAFTPHYRVIRFDMLGYGKSDKPTHPVSRRDELYQLLKYLNVDKAHLLGCSIGGETVIDLALEHPEVVSSLIPVSAAPVGFELQGEPPPNMLDMMTAAQQGDLKRASELQLRLWIDGMYRQPEQVDPQVRQHAAKMNWIEVSNKRWMLDMQPPPNPLTPPAAQRVAEIQVPALVIAGALDHPEILRAADVMVSAINGAQKVVIPDSAHLPNMEKPAAFNRAVLDFLSRVGQSYSQTT
jgi:pimeloyl-ACP methyl ester carboxylesterase